jgi:hypothetical protein
VRTHFDAWADHLLAAVNSRGKTLNRSHLDAPALELSEARRKALAEAQPDG